MLLLQSPELLFQQLISMGGTPLLLPDLPRVVSEDVYSTIAAALNVDKLSAEERVNYILNCPMEELYSKLPPGLPLIPVVDDDLVKALPTYKQTLKYGPTEMLPGMTWCKRLLIGDCQFDVCNAHISNVPTISANRFVTRVLSTRVLLTPTCLTWAKDSTSS